MRILDTHLHLWDPARLRYPWLDGIPSLNRELASPQALAAMAHANVQPETIFMQADCLADQALAEVEWVAAQRDRIQLRGIVAFAPIEDAGLAEHLDRLASHELVVGVRRLIQGEKAGFATSDPVITGARELAARGLVFDACVQQHQIAEVTELADAVPELQIVLDHLGKPEVGTAASPVLPSETWERNMRELGKRDNVTCKLSGLPGESGGQWNEAQLEPFLDVAAEAFGPDRLMFASDWGASFSEELVKGYGRWLEFVTRWAGDSAPKVLAGTGARVYLGEND